MYITIFLIVNIVFSIPFLYWIVPWTIFGRDRWNKMREERKWRVRHERYKALEDYHVENGLSRDRVKEALMFECDAAIFKMYMAKLQEKRRK